MARRPAQLAYRTFFIAILLSLRTLRIATVPIADLRLGLVRSERTRRRRGADILPTAPTFECLARVAASPGHGSSPADEHARSWPRARLTIGPRRREVPAAGHPQRART